MTRCPDQAATERTPSREPDFIIIGAPKCGTTWLHRRLAAHPSIMMPANEVHYFSRYMNRGWLWYLSHFLEARTDQRAGENSNSYVTDQSALAHLREHLPGARILCMLRNPIERAYSSYGMQVDRGRATTDIDRYLDPERSPLPHILTNGLYAGMLEPWLKSFPRERVFVGLFDDIQNEPIRLYQRVLSFLEVNSDFVPPDIDERENARKTRDVPGPVKRALWLLRPHLESGYLMPLIRGPFGKGLRQMLARPKRYPQLTPAHRERLSRYYATDIARLETMLGKSLDAWRSTAPA